MYLKNLEKTPRKKSFFSKPLFMQKKKKKKKKKLSRKTCNSTLLDIYRISVGEKLKIIKRKENIIILKYTHKEHIFVLH